MNRQEALDAYNQALHRGQKTFRELEARGKSPYPAVLDEILADVPVDSSRYIGILEIPADRIVGTKSAGRISAFSADFSPLLRPETEFGIKWIDLCMAHLGDEGIRDPITCFEYLGNFYVQEGNKRVSVLKHFGAPRIPAIVYRILPPRTDAPEVRAYYEFLEFYRSTEMYDFQFRRPGGYSKLLAAWGMQPDDKLIQQEKRTISAYFQYFKEAYYALGGAALELSPEEALLLWLQLHTYRELGTLSSGELKKALSTMWGNIVAQAQPNPVEVRTEAAAEPKSNLLSKLMLTTPEHLHVAFVHMLNTANSEWVQAHEQGRCQLVQELGYKVTTASYFDANTPEKAENILEQAVTDGANVIFTTAAQLSAPSLKLAVKYPRLWVFNCSVDIPFSSIRTYYSRIYEGKFITGAIAGAMARESDIGYVGTYPILGELASINAFTLGAQLTNPRARVHLRWSCVPGDCVNELIRKGVRVVSNRDIPTADTFHPHYGTYTLDEHNQLVPLVSPCWMWGNFYVKILDSIISGAWSGEKNATKAVNYWWGMRSGVIDVKPADGLPDGLRTLSEILRQGLQNGTIDPFRRRIVTQDGTVKNDGSRSFAPEEILHMDYLCQGVEGSIPSFDELLPRARPMVRALGIYRDEIPPERGVGFP